MTDLIIFTADKDAEQCLEGLLPKLHLKIEVRKFTYKVKKHKMHDAGCRKSSHDLLRAECKLYNYCIVMLDWEGAGFENGTAEDLEKEISHNLSINGWENRNAVIVIQPELENWMWVRSPNVAKQLGWDSVEDLYTELQRQNFMLSEVTGKPLRPKEAFERVLRLKDKPRSSSIFKEIASTVSFKNCVDPSFLKFQQLLLNWFPKK